MVIEKAQLAFERGRLMVVIEDELDEHVLLEGRNFWARALRFAQDLTQAVSLVLW